VIKKQPFFKGWEGKKVMREKGQEEKKLKEGGRVTYARDRKKMGERDKDRDRWLKMSIRKRTGSRRRYGKRGIGKKGEDGSGKRLPHHNSPCLKKSLVYKEKGEKQDISKG